jgi:hypothetical protein
MNTFVKKNRVIVSVLLLWLFYNMICLIFSEPVSNSKSEFYPFTKYAISKTYDYTEFIIYGFSPIILLIIVKLNNYEKN